MLHTFDGPYYMKNEKYMKRHDYIFHVAGSIESTQHGYSMEEESNYVSNESCCLTFE